MAGGNSLPSCGWEDDRVCMFALQDQFIGFVLRRLPGLPKCTLINLSIKRMLALVQESTFDLH